MEIRAAALRKLKSECIRNGAQSRYICVLLLFLFSAVLPVIIGIWRAPEGFEDETGFHLGKRSSVDHSKPEPEQTRSTSAVECRP
jgi:hypothetical protein